MVKPLIFLGLNEAEQAAINTILGTYEGDKLAEEQEIYAKGYKSGEGDVHDVVVAQLELNARQRNNAR